MNVSPIRQSTVPERHVHFSNHVQENIIQPTESEPIQPSLYAQQLERQLRQTPNVAPQSQPAQSAPVRVYKNLLHRAALVCGALVLPSLTCLVLGPIGLIAPAALAVLTVLLYLLAGKPTEAMEQSLAIRRAQMRTYDPR